MIPTYESFLEATPDKGVIIVEYYWQPPLTFKTKRARSDKDRPAGRKTSMVFFKRLRVSDSCWCGSKRQFGRCHRREDDWTFVTLDPGQHAFSPVVLCERTFTHTGYAEIRNRLEADTNLLPTELSGDHGTWAIQCSPHIQNEIGELILGTLTVNKHELMIETNSEQRFDYLTGQLREWFGDSVHAAHTRRAEPQRGFVPTPRRKRG